MPKWEIKIPVSSRLKVKRTAKAAIKIAMDMALTCSYDHPWLKQHPDWFFHNPDGSIKYAENPPKKYQDIYPINFWPAAADGSPDDVARIVAIADQFVRKVRELAELQAVVE